jgi:glycosyltransferase involved in cell wall biosynthesis
MRVLLVAHHLPPDGAAGVERLVQNLAGELLRAGDSVAVVSRRIGDAGSPAVQRETLFDGGLHYRLAGGTRSLEHFLAHHERLDVLFGSVLAEFDPEVVHVHHLFGLSPRFVELAHRLCVPTVVSLHDYYFACPRIVLRKPSGELCSGPDGGRECARTCYAGDGADARIRWGTRDAYFRALLRLPELLIAPSEHIAGFFERFIGDGERIRMIPNGVSLPRRLDEPEATPRSRGCLNLAYLGTIAPHKGVHVIVEALRLAELPAVSLLVAGDSAEPQYLSALERDAAKVPGLDFQVQPTYELDELPDLLAQVDSIVMPSQWPETFGIVAREALIRGVPIVVSRMGGLPDAVDEGRNGFTFAADRPDELAEILRRLSRDDDLVRRLRRGARATPVLSSSEHARATRAAYEEAAAARRAMFPADQLRFLHEAARHMGFAAA